MSFIKRVVGGIFGGAGAAEQAARLQQEGAQAGIGRQEEQFASILELLGPSIEGGDLARQQQLALLGLLGPEAQQAAQTQFTDSPGQQFIRERQQRALTRNASAIGGLGGGNIRTALQEQAAGFAAQDFGNQFNRLGGIAGLGQQAATNLGQFGQASTQNITNLLTQQGQAGASGVLGAQQANTGLAQNLIGLGTAIFSDSRLKDNITKIGKIGCLNVYEWTWKTTGLDDVGFIAEDVKEHFPDLVQEHNGFLKVNYDHAIKRAA